METNKQTIESGIISNAVKGLTKMFGEAFVDTLEELDRETKDVRTNSKGEILTTVFPKDGMHEPYFLKIDQYEFLDDGTLRGYLSLQDPSKKIYPNVMQLFWKQSEETQNSSDESENSSESKQQNIQDFLDGNPTMINEDEYKDMLDKFENTVMVRFPIAASMKISLQKITASEEPSIELLGVETEQDPTTALANIDTLLNDEEFIASIPEDTVSNYTVYDQENNLQVEPFTESAEFGSEYALDEILTYALIAKNVVDHIYYSMNSTADCLSIDARLAERERWLLDDCINQICRFIKIAGHTIPDFNSTISNNASLALYPNDIAYNVKSLIDCIKLFQGQIPQEEIVSEFDHMLVDLEASIA